MTAIRTSVLLAALSALGWLAAIQLLAWRAAGVFEYPLDDVYIHLAIAQRIAGGTYGINPGEPAAAASSVLYPLLLVPFPGTALQWLLPAVWNTLAVGAAGAIWGWTVARLARPAGLALAVLGPPLLYISGLGFIGMEHGLHLVASMLTIIGLWHWLEHRRLAWWFVLALVVAPLIRFEGLALSLLSAGAVAVSGRPKAGVLLGLGAVIPVALFALFLTAQGLPAVPNSLRVKINDVSEDTGLLGRVASTLAFNTRHLYGAGLLFLAVLAGLAAALGRGSGRARLLLGTAAAGLLAHILLGHVGWLNRYETYAVVTLAVSVVLGWDAARGRRGGLLGGLTAAGLMLVPGVAITLPSTLVSYIYNPRAIHLQQGQMARLSHEFLPVPVAVNDLGRVAWNAPAHVLDLWGLASVRALRLRLDAGSPPGWAGPLAAEKGVRYAMVYDRWLERAIPPDWVRVGELRYSGPSVFLGGAAVAFYATDAGFVPRMRSAIEDWIPGLPQGAAFAFDGEAGR